MVCNGEGLNILVNVGRDFAKIISEGISCFLPFLSMVASAPVIEGSWRNHQGAPSYNKSHHLLQTSEDIGEKTSENTKNNKGGIPKNKLHHWLHTLGKFRKDPIQKTRKHQSTLKNMKGPPYKTNHTIYSKHHKAKTHQKILKKEYRKAPKHRRKCWRSLSENEIPFRNSLFWNVSEKTSCRISF